VPDCACIFALLYQKEKVTSLCRQLTTVILTASSNCLIATLTSADAKSSMIRGFLNWNKRDMRKKYTEPVT